MRFVATTQTLQSNDVAASNAGYRHNAGPYWITIHQHGTCATLCQPTAKFRTIELQIIAQHIQKWCLWFYGITHGPFDAQHAVYR